MSVCLSWCLAVCLSVCVCVHDNEVVYVVYENDSDEFDIRHCPIKVKVTA